MKLPVDPRLPIQGGQDYDRSLYQRLYALFRGIAQSVNAGVDATDANTSAIATNTSAITELSINAQWYGKAIGEVFYLRDDLAATVKPPTDNAHFRFVKLTAADAYNAGVLTGESVTGSAPLVIATAVISLVGSALNGMTVNLINTERRVVRAGESGTIEQDALQNITGTFGSIGSLVGSSYPIGVQEAGGAFVKNDTSSWAHQSGGMTANNGATTVTFDASFVARTAIETRAKSIGATAYMRIL